MDQKYVVYVDAPAGDPSPELRRRLAELLKLDESRLDHLLRRLPGEVTKPVGETTAITVARRFRDAGLPASIRPEPKKAPAQQEASAPDRSSLTDSTDRQGNRPSSAPSPIPSEPSRVHDEQRERPDEGSRPPGEDEPLPSEQNVHPAAQDHTEGAAKARVDRKPEPSGFEDDDNDDDLAWQSEFGSRRAVTNEEDAVEDELFPSTSFRTSEGPKAPSRSLVIALVAVLAVFVALWLFL